MTQLITKIFFNKSLNHFPFLRCRKIRVDSFIIFSYSFWVGFIIFSYSFFSYSFWVGNDQIFFKVNDNHVRFESAIKKLGIEVRTNSLFVCQYCGINHYSSKQLVVTSQNWLAEWNNFARSTEIHIRLWDIKNLTSKGLL